MSYTKIPNELIENAVRECSPSAFVLLMFIARKTIGWQKKSDKITHTQIQINTRLNSINTIKRAAKELERYGYVSIKREPNGWVYRLKIDPSFFDTQPSNFDTNNGSSLSNFDKIPSKNDTTKETIQNKEYKYTPPRNKDGSLSAADAFEIAWQAACNADTEGIKNGDQRILAAVQQFGWPRLRQWDTQFKITAKREFTEIYNNVKQ